MTDVWFYHLEASGVADVLPGLVEKALARGWRGVILTADETHAEALDTLLWTYDAASFLPHARADAPAADRSPVIVAAGAANMAGRQVVFLADGAEMPPLDGLERGIVLFDGRDDAALERARGNWRALKAAGHAVTYWQQGGVGWEKKA